MVMWIKDKNGELKAITEKEYFESMTKKELIEIVLEYYHQLYDEY